ncbi:MAG: NosD domain-containing protein [Candidatus Thorarchaeota archaeon]
MISNITSVPAYSNPLTCQEIVTSAITPHSPIVINHIDNFTHLGLLGNGTKDNPFLIDAYSISETRTCINITGTSAFVNIQRCILTPFPNNASLHGTFGIFLLNVSNCNVIDCEINGGYWSVWMRDCDRCGIRESDIKGDDACIIIEESTHCNVSFDILYGYTGAGLYFQYCNYSLASYNSVEGQGTGRVGIGVWGESDPAWFCVIANNTITEHREDAIHLEGIGCLVINNTITNNDFGIDVQYPSRNNTISFNVLSENSVSNGIDNGIDNAWISNWYDDYSGIGPYTIPGIARSIDLSPRPQKSQSLDIAAIFSVVAIPLIITSLILVIVWKLYRRN